MDGERIVEDGYDRLAERYLATKDEDDPLVWGALEKATQAMTPGGTVLDLGCGAGVPATRWLSRRFLVTGVDVSARQLELARSLVPAATFVKGSMTEVEFPPATFDLVTALHSIIHVPRGKQPSLFRRIQRWLKPGGALLATLASGAWEGTEENWEDWGTPMWWSHLDAATTLHMIQDAGLRVESAEEKTGNGETWLWVIARTDIVAASI